MWVLSIFLLLALTILITNVVVRKNFITKAILANSILLISVLLLCILAFVQGKDYYIDIAIILIILGFVLNYGIHHYYH